MQSHPPTHPLPPPARRPQATRRIASLPVWFVLGVVSVTLISAGVIGVLVFTTIRQAFARFEEPGSTPIPYPWDTPAATLPPGTTATPVSGTNWQCDSTERVTVLVMGIDQRKGEKAEEAGPFRTDTMMLLSLDPLNKTAVMLSIPRDLWVTIPDFGYGRVNDRINTANVYGEVNEYPGGGPGLAMATTRLNLGIPVDHYIQINFSAFEDFVDIVGGIDVDVPEDIYDPSYPTMDYGVELFELAAGEHHLDGPTALKYARTRHTIGSDFDRAKRQQQVIMAIRDKVTNLNLLPQLITRVPELYVTFSDSMKTDLPVEKIICLAQIGQSVPRTNIRSAVLNENYTTNWTTPEGAQVLVPDRDSISRLMLELYTPPTTPLVTTVTPDPRGQLSVENARVLVENGTLTAGLASKTADWLTLQGINISGATNADRFDYPATQIIDYTGKPYTTRFLAELFNVQPENILSGSNPESPVDIKVILGGDTPSLP